MHVRPFRVLVTVLAIVLASSAPKAQSVLGTIDFPTSGAKAAQPAFIRGVLLLHSFEYDDAKDAFVEAERLDPGFAMAYWGEAMTANHPLWNQTAPDQARAALAKLGATLAARQAKAPTQKEKDWLASIEPLYGQGDKKTRDTAYAAALADMHARYPDDLEVTSFYALAVLGSSGTTRDYTLYMRAAALAESVYVRNPKHPGAVHYLIHAFDDPVHAPLGLRYADAYGTIAADASHALHMPAHIYFALGMWDEAATMNERSVKAADDRVAAKHLGIDDRGFHALQWLNYAYLQQGRYQAAKGVVAQLESDAAKSGSTRTRSSLALVRAAWLIETRRWADAKAPVNPTGLGADAVTADLFAIGFASAKSGNLAGARDARQKMTPLAGDLAGAPRVPAVMALELDATIALAEGRKDEAVALAKKATSMEDALNFEFGPPNPIKPAHELAGEILLEAGRAVEAQKEFEIALAHTPGRALTLVGLSTAAASASDAKAAARAGVELSRIWKRADADVTARRGGL